METKKKEKLGYKDWLAIITSYTAFAIGWILIIVNFFVSPIGDVNDSSLYILGQSLLYTASVIGVATYTRGEIRKIRYKVGIEDKDDDDDDEE